jgi:hypothetical protein
VHLLVRLLLQVLGQKAPLLLLLLWLLQYCRVDVANSATAAAVAAAADRRRPMSHKQ